MNETTPLPPPVALPDLFDGAWRLRRLILDRKTGGVGRLSGMARFAPDTGGLRFSEKGRLRLGLAEMDAARAYRYAILGPRQFRVFFDDGRLFHDAVVGDDGAAPVSHDCAPDLYRGRYRIESADRWRLSWRITGPRKDLVIGSVFSR